MTATQKTVRVSALKPGNKVVFKLGRDRAVSLVGMPLVVKEITRLPKEKTMILVFFERPGAYSLPWDRRVTLIQDPSWEVVAVGGPTNEAAPTYALPRVPPVAPIKCDDPSPIIAAESSTDSFVVGGAVGGCRKPSAQGCPCPCVAPAKKRERPAMPPNPGPPRQVGMTQVQRDDLLLAVLNAVNEFTEKMRSLVKKATGI